jgi:putative spermidine/putrescine transport system permease protein
MSAQATHPGLSRRHRLAERGIDGQLLLLLPAVVFVIGLFIYPFLYGLGLSFQPAKGGGPFADYQRFFTDAFQRDTIWKTLRLSIPAALFNVLAVGASGASGW